MLDKPDGDTHKMHCPCQMRERAGPRSGDCSKSMPMHLMPQQLLPTPRPWPVVSVLSMTLQHLPALRKWLASCTSFDRSASRYQTHTKREDIFFKLNTTHDGTQNSEEMPPRCLKMALRCPEMDQDAPKESQERPRMDQDGPRLPKRCPKMAQDGSEMSQDSRMMPQKDHKTAPRWAKMGQDCPTDTPRWLKMAPRWPKMAPPGLKEPQESSQIVQDGPR